MEHALAELPLAIFTTLAPIGAGAFIALALVLNTISFNDDQLKKLDKFTLIPLGAVIIGLFASVLHLTTPLNAIHVIGGLGRSPLTNEIAVAGVFTALAFVYCVLALWGKLSLAARKIFSVIVAVAALVFAVFVGLAYTMNTIVSWNTPYTTLEIVGFCLLGGSMLGIFIMILAGVFDEVRASKNSSRFLLAMAGLGTLLAVGAMIGHAIFVNGLYSPVHPGSEMLAEVLFLLVIFIVGALATFACEVFLVLKETKKVFAIAGLTVAVISIFAARMVFYATQMSVGIS